MSELAAYCNSIKCAHMRKAGGQGHSSLGVKKDVPRSANFCPDCRSAIMWARNKVGPYAKRAGATVRKEKLAKLHGTIFDKTRI